MISAYLKSLESYIPNLNGYLNEGASQTDIINLEAQTGFEFPQSFKELYVVYNGEKEHFGLFFGLTWFSIEKIASNWKTFKEISGECISCDVVSFEKDKIQETYFNAGWVPFACDHAGNYIAFDFAPGMNGKIGQIINCGRDEETLYVIGETFDELLKLLVQQFENGNCTFAADEDGYKYVSWNGDGHFFDDVKSLVYKADIESNGEAEIIELDKKWNSMLQKSYKSVPKTLEEFKKIKRLTLLNTDIDDLSPLIYFKDLRELVASGLNINDYHPISCLEDLKKLYLAKTPVSDLKFLEPLKNLKQLSLGNTRVKEIDVLAELPQLEDLSLENLKIDDLSPLLRCKRLKCLDLSGVKTKKIIEIAKLTELAELDITGINYDDLSFLKGLAKLKRLSFKDPQKGDYSIFEELTNIERMTCSFNSFVKTKNLFDRKVQYTIMGRISDEEYEIYHTYVMEG